MLLLISNNTDVVAVSNNTDVVANQLVTLKELYSTTSNEDITRV